MSTFNATVKPRWRAFVGRRHQEKAAAVGAEPEMLSVKASARNFCVRARACTSRAQKLKWRKTKKKKNNVCVCVCHHRHSSNGIVYGGGKCVLPNSTGGHSSVWCTISERYIQAEKKKPLEVQLDLPKTQWNQLEVQLVPNGGLDMSNWTSGGFFRCYI